MMNTILFDLDGTLLPMDVEEFTKKYFYLISKKMSENGRDGEMILKAVLKGTAAMIKNNTTKTNEEVFWEAFSAATQIPREEIEDEFNDFYAHDFDQIGIHGEKNENMIQAVQLLKQKGYHLFLTTNPLFPRIATLKRIKWAGLDENDFEDITTYENSHACKPNLVYYQEVILKHHLDINKCIMVGNDVKEDGIIEQMGIPVYLVNDYLLNTDNLEINAHWHTNSEKFLQFVQKLPILK